MMASAAGSLLTKLTLMVGKIDAQSPSCYFSPCQIALRTLCSRHIIVLSKGISLHEIKLRL